LDQAGGDSEDGDEESDDEGDLFRQSYEEFSGTRECPLLKKARALLIRWKQEYGPSPKPSFLEDIVEKMRTGGDLVALEEEYQEWVKMDAD
jgi:hypothetical protein